MSTQSPRYLVFWRHAEAVDASADILDTVRPLTKKGQAQAKQITHWLQNGTLKNILKNTLIFCSPTTRTIQTIEPLGKQYTVLSELSPEANFKPIMHLIRRFPNQHILLVGHEPWISEVLTRLLDIQEDTLDIKKGSLWCVAQETGAPPTSRLFCAQLPD
jgi:phosphohistidine phosphatase